LGLAQRQVRSVLTGKLSPGKVLAALERAGYATSAEVHAARAEFLSQSGRAAPASASVNTERAVELSQFLQQRRKAAGLSANGLAKLAHVPQSNIWLYEKRGINLSAASAGKIARALQLNAKETEDFLELQQQAASPAARGGNAAWVCALESALVKLGCPIHADDAFVPLASAAIQVPERAVKKLRSKLAKRAHDLKSAGLTPQTVDAIIRHQDGTATLLAITVAKVPIALPPATKLPR